MGCASSSPAAVEGSHRSKGSATGSFTAARARAAAHATGDGDGTDGHPLESDAAREKKSGNTRARRLSYVTGDANGQATVGNPTPLSPTPPGGGGKADAARPGSAANSSNARARRLSYVSNDPNGPNPVLLGAGGEGEEAEYEAGQEEMGLRSLADGDRQLGLPSQVPASASGEAIRLSVACMSRAGREPGFKKTNQDSCFAFEKYITEDQSLFGAMDGHGPNGHLVSGYVKQHLPIILVKYLTAEGDPTKALSSGFAEVDASLGNSRIDCEFSGSTCVVAYLKGTTLTTAWVGDSRGVLAREGLTGLEAVDLTVDHKPTDPEEKERILKSNGRVERLVDEFGQPMGPHRVWLQYAWIPGLAMSRAIGDVLAHQVGVSSEPQHSVTKIGPQDKFIVLASDGVWEFISSKEAVEIISKCDSTEEACRQLVDEAFQRWLTEEEGVVDDITAVVIRFLH